ncbi:MAG: hypothetical protein GC151_03710 [Betaproteobacteria bacterium]|nr:hypothetical protein [Betaproteobacteria bacterium]
MTTRRTHEAQLARALVGGQFLLLGLWVLTGHVLAATPTGRVVQALGVALALWAFAVMIRAQGRMFRISPIPEGHRTLVRSGPYRWIRHPMYASIFLVVTPPVAEWRTGPGVLLLVSLALVIVSKLQFEERLLLDRFPGYADYRRATARIIPFLY